MANKRLLVFLLIIILLSLLSIYYPQLKNITGYTEKEYYPRENAILIRVIDGDTIETNLGNVRLLGINTPEKGMPFANDAKEFLKQFEGKNIELLRDFEDTDKYKRKLRYVFYENQLLNQEILENGFANAYYYAGLKYESAFLLAEKNARENNLGIWTKSTDICAINSCIYLKSLDASEEFFTLANECDFDCSLEGWFVKDAGRNTFYLTPLQANQEKTYPSNGKEIWNNNGDQFFMFDKSGLLVIYSSYL